MLAISTLKIAHAIAYARQHDNSAASWDRQMQEDFEQELGHAILGAFAGGTSRGALADFIGALSKDEQASLLAVAWIGRGAVHPEDLDAAIRKAKAEHIDIDDDYLIGIPLLAEYLLDGMEKLGFPIADLDPNIRLA